MKFDYFITDGGILVPAKPGAVAGNLGAAFASPSIEAVAISNVGFIGLRCGPHGIKVRMRPSATTEIALAALFEWLSDRDESKIALELFDDELDEWRTTIASGFDQAFGEVAEAVLDAEARRNRRVLSRSINPDSLTQSHPFSSALRSWQRTDVFTDFLNSDGFAALGGRYIIYRHDVVMAVELLEAIGDAKPARLKDTLAPCLGRSIETVPDVWFGRATADVLQMSAAAGRPILQDVDAIVDWPGNKGCRHAYRRIILPLRHMGGIILVSGAIEDRSINLRSGGQMVA